MNQVAALFADVSNLYYCVNKKFGGRKLDYKKLLEKAKANYQMYRAFAYGAQLNDEAMGFITCLKHFGFDPKYKRPKQYAGENPDSKKEVRKADWDVGIAMDVVRLVDNGKLDVVILATADGDLAPLVEWVKEKGIRCIILACGISRDLKDVADQYIEITEELLEEKKESVPA